MNDFKKRYRKAVSQQRAAQRMRRGRKRDKWAGRYLGVQKGTTRETKEVPEDGAGGANTKRGPSA